ESTSTRPIHHPCVPCPRAKKRRAKQLAPSLQKIRPGTETFEPGSKCKKQPSLKRTAARLRGLLKSGGRRPCLRPGHCRMPFLTAPISPVLPPTSAESF